MYKLIFILSVFTLVSCDLVTYTVKNNSSQPVKVKGDNLKDGLTLGPGECVEFFDVFGLYGEFPLQFFNSSDVALAQGKSYEPGNYLIGPSGSVTEVTDEKACVATRADTGVESPSTPDPAPGTPEAKSPAKPKGPPEGVRSSNRDSVPKPASAPAEEEKTRNPHTD